MFQVMQMSPKHQLEILERDIRQNLTKEHRKKKSSGKTVQRSE